MAKLKTTNERILYIGSIPVYPEETEVPSEVDGLKLSEHPDFKKYASAKVIEYVKAGKAEEPKE